MLLGKQTPKRGHFKDIFEEAVKYLIFLISILAHIFLTCYVTKWEIGIKLCLKVKCLSPDGASVWLSEL